MSIQPASEAPAATSASTPEAAPGTQRLNIELDDSHLVSLYANFARVNGTPEELILDFSLNPQPLGVPPKPIKITQRLIVNFYTAKRLLQALQMALARHEAVFGVLETDVRKRARSIA